MSDEMGTEAFTESGGASAKFTEKGKWLVGTIVSVSKKQETDFATKKPVFWDDGEKKMQNVITLQTDERDDGDDDGVRAIYCKIGQTRAVGDAIKATGYKGSMVGGKLGVVWYESEDTGKGNPLKLWRAKFEPPAATEQFADDEPPEDDDLTAPF